MRRKKRRIIAKKERVVLSDILPYEIPVIFSNRHFYDFLVDNGLEINGNKIKWINNDNDTSLNDIVKLLFGFPENKQLSNNNNQIEIEIKGKELKTIPFSFKISHKEGDFRELTIIHPKNQLAIIEFYNQYKDLIIYYCKASPFSIRKPHRVAKITYYKDRTHYENLAHDHEHKSVEESDKEHENLITYFVYDDFSNIYKFYESYKYIRCEKKYNRLFTFDISKCFDSIYTHSIAWALLNKDLVKDKTEASNNTFSGSFDRIMQNLNYGETHGIIISPEFSRIFAELILQQIDTKVQSILNKKNLIYKKDYEIFRYVDDFFVFYNEESIRELILETYRLQLKEYKLYLNDVKRGLFDKPMITGITRAKNQISELFNDKSFLSYRKNTDRAKFKKFSYSLYASSNRYITKFKAIIKETGVDYSDILNYSLACIDQKVLELIETCNKFDAQEKRNREQSTTVTILEILDFTFFLYSGSPRVNTTINLCKILSKITKFAQVKGNFNNDNKHLILKKIYDEIFLVLRKNRSSEYTQVEILYLLIALKELGREYRLNEQLLCDYCNIDLAKNKCTKPLNYFSIVVLLFYIEDKIRYKRIQDILKTHIKTKFIETTNEKRRKTTELTLLLFDLLACPFIDESFKRSLLSLYGIKNESRQIAIIEYGEYWFTKWTEFDFIKELDEKKSQEVY